MNNWYNRIVQSSPPTQMNMIQRAQIVMNALKDPVSFVKEQFPDVPENIQNNPDAILHYLQQTRGNNFTQQMMQISGMNGRR